MRRIKVIVLSIVVLGTVVMASAFTKSSTNDQHREVISEQEEHQLINMFVSHGHCSLPFTGVVSEVNVKTQIREDSGNPLEEMEISFEINPQTFNACRGEDLTERVKTPGLFIDERKENIKFRSTSVYTMGIDWYQVNGKLSIKGDERDVKFFASGIRNPNESMSSQLILEGQLDLSDWGIDYDLIVNGKSDAVATKWMHLNMKIDLM